MIFRIGNGYDVHQLVENRKLILGGVIIPHTKGLLGHSDADVLIHAIIDSLLGAMSLPDIGHQFPDTDNRYKDISSLLLLRETNSLLKKNNYCIGNIDTIIVAQKPKLSNYINEMQINISNCLEIDNNQINIKATTEEYLGFTGKEQGISAYSVCLIYKNNE